jgi:heme exporter protein B
MLPYWLLWKRDLRLARQNLSEALNPILFFTLVILLFPLALGASQKLLSEVASGVLWVAILLSILLSLDRLFRSDLQEGLLEQWLCRGGSLVGYVLIRLASSWLLLGLPLLLIVPIMAITLGLPSNALPCLLLSLVFASGAMIFIGAIGSALTTSLPKAGILLALVILPFYIPILIFAASATSVAGMGLEATGQLYVLAALWVFSAILSPLAIATALRLGIAQA